MLLLDTLEVVVFKLWPIIASFQMILDIMEDTDVIIINNYLYCAINSPWYLYSFAIIVS